MKEVLESVPADERTNGVKDLDLHVDPPPIGASSWVKWCVERDTLDWIAQFHIVFVHSGRDGTLCESGTAEDTTILQTRKLW